MNRLSFITRSGPVGADAAAKDTESGRIGFVEVLRTVVDGPPVHEV